MTSLETLVYLIKGRNYPVPSVLRESDTQEHQKHTQLLLVRHFVVFTTIWRHLWSIIEQTRGSMVPFG